MKRESQLCAVVAVCFLHCSSLFSFMFYYGGWCVCNCVETLTVELEVGWSSASQWMIIVMRVLTCWRISLNMNCYVLKGWHFRS